MSARACPHAGGPAHCTSRAHTCSEIPLKPGLACHRKMTVSSGAAERHWEGLDGREAVYYQGESYASASLFAHGLGSDSG